MSSSISGFLVGVIGLVCFSGAVFDWNWFMNSRRAQLLIMLLGRTGARVFYSIGGILFFILGTGMLFGLDQSW